MSPRRPHRAFTLVELLVVIVIIALLAAMITPAVMAAMRAAKRAQISGELSQLHSAIEAYKTQYGSYPPSNVTQFKAHLQQIFINLDTTTEFTAANLPTTMDNAQMLYFVLKGYSADKRHPLSGAGDRKSAFPFDPKRIDNSVTPPRYLAHNSTKPYVYFDCSRYPTTNSTESYSNGGTAKPYKLPTAQGGGYANAKSFQIITSGLDNDYGTDTGYVLDNTGVKDAHTDNITNFSEGKQLIDYIDK
jgi:prepilin-type N-terminal cleavage/methylation domain-containing protein